MVYNNVPCNVVASYVVYKLSAQRNVTPWLAHAAGFLRPMLVIKSNPIYELRPRFTKAKCREFVTASGVNREKLSESPSPDSAEKLQCEKEGLLVSFLTDKDCNASRSDPDIENLL